MLQVEASRCTVRFSMGGIFDGSSADNNKDDRVDTYDDDDVTKVENASRRWKVCQSAFGDDDFANAKMRIKIGKKRGL